MTGCTLNAGTSGADPDCTRQNHYHRHSGPKLFQKSYQIAILPVVRLLIWLPANCNLSVWTKAQPAATKMLHHWLSCKLSPGHKQKFSLEDAMTACQITVQAESSSSPRKAACSVPLLRQTPAVVVQTRCPKYPAGQLIVTRILANCHCQP